MAKNGFSMSNRVAVEEVTGAKTLTVDDCGKVVIMASASAAYTVRLPTAATAGAGWNCALVIGATLKAHIIATGSAESAANVHIVGAGNEVDATVPYSGSGGSAVSKIQFNPTSGMKQGDRVEFTTDGSDWYAKILAFNQAAYNLA